MTQVNNIVMVLLEMIKMTFEQIPIQASFDRARTNIGTHITMNSSLILSNFIKKNLLTNNDHAFHL